MKKLLILLFIFGYNLAFTQSVVIMNNLASTASGNYFWGTPNASNIGSVQIVTSSAFNGSTSTIDLEASNDNLNWSVVFEDDNTTPLSFTLSAGANSYTWILKTQSYSYYRVVYDKGNATLGTIKTTVISK